MLAHEQLLGTNRDGSAAVDSSRALLLTLLGEFVLPMGGSAWTKTIVAAAESLGIRDKAARQALARMDEGGWLDRTKVGRQTRWSLSPYARTVLESGAERIYSFGATTRQWDGRWIVLLASVPERDRHLRYAMANGLGWAGFGTLGNGTWLSPWLGQEGTAVELLNGLGVEAISFRAEVGNLGSPTGLVAQAWDLPELRHAYTRFLTDVDLLDGQSSSDLAAVAELTGLVHQWRRFPLLDPDLPAELLPASWPGVAAAQRFGELRARLRGPAMAWWEATEAELTPGD